MHSSPAVTGEPRAADTSPESGERANRGPWTFDRRCRTGNQAPATSLQAWATRKHTTKPIPSGARAETVVHFTLPVSL